jgi:hypothetical protein
LDAQRDDPAKPEETAEKRKYGRLSAERFEQKRDADAEIVPDGVPRFRRSGRQHDLAVFQSVGGRR